MKILRTIDSFQPAHRQVFQQAWQISQRLEHKGIHSPILTTVDPDHPSPPKAMLGPVPITRVPVQFSVGRYPVSLGMITYLRNYSLIHGHIYRTFQTDCAFFLRGFGTNRLS